MELQHLIERKEILENEITESSPDVILNEMLKFSSDEDKIVPFVPQEDLKEVSNLSSNNNNSNPNDKLAVVPDNNEKQSIPSPVAQTSTLVSNIGTIANNTNTTTSPTSSSSSSSAITSPTAASSAAATISVAPPITTTSTAPPITIPSGIPATWSEHLQQQKQLGAKPGPSLPSLSAAKNENQHNSASNSSATSMTTTPTNINHMNNNATTLNPNHVFYDNHGKPIVTNRPPTSQFPGYPQQLHQGLPMQQHPPHQPHEIPSPSSIDIAASGGFWSTLQKQPMQRWGDENNAGNPPTTETLTKEQRVLHDDLVTAIYAYNVNAAVSTLRKMYTKQTRTFRIPTVLGILLPDTAAMIVDGRTDLLNVAVCFALDSIQWCFGVQKGENIESFKYKMNANIARWILHETVKKGIPTTPTPVIQEATISVVNHILENVVELEFAWEMLTTLNISHPVQRIVPHVLAWRGYPNPSIEGRVNEFLYDHPEIGSIIPPSNPNPNLHMPPQPPMNFRPGSGPVSPTGGTNMPNNDRTSQMVHAFLRDQQIHHPGLDYPMNSHIPNPNPNHQQPLPPDVPDDPMLDRKFRNILGRPPSNELGPRMSPLYRDEFNDPRLRGIFYHYYFFISFFFRYLFIYFFIFNYFKVSMVQIQMIKCLELSLEILYHLQMDKITHVEDFLEIILPLHTWIIH